MPKVFSIIATLLPVILLISCSEKSHPAKNNASAAVKKDTAAAVKKIKTPIPKVIVVNDKAASKSIDGRYYYDLEGKRYWRNKKDGKYYLFNKSMYNNPAFQP